MLTLNQFKFLLFWVVFGSHFSFGQTQLANLDPFNSDLYDKFGNGSGIDRVYKVLELSNGKMLVGGTFAEVNGFPIFGLARLNADGSFDHTFHSGFDFAADIYALVELPSGKIVVGGSFNSYDGISCGNFVVLNANGIRDMTYTGVGTSGSSSEINDIQLAAGNKLIVAGYFSSFNGVLRNGLVRLTSSLQVDTSFGTTYTGSSVGEFYTVLTFPDGGILVGGDFENYWGNGANGLIKLTASGSPDPNFDLYTPVGFNTTINKVKFTSDGKILMCGRFNSYGGNPSECIVRLNANGSVDNSFQSSVSMQSNSLLDCVDFNNHVIIIGGPNAIDYLNNNGTLLQGMPPMLNDNTISLVDKISNGAFIVGGSFSKIMGRRSNGLLKFSNIGEVDNHFFTPPASHNRLSWYGDGMVEHISKYGNSQYMVSGHFTEFNGDTINGLVRLDYNGGVDLTFNAHFPTSVVINAMTVQPDGKILVNYQDSNPNDTPKLVRLETNGDPDTTFSCSLQYPVYKIILTAGNKITIAGDRNYSSSGWKAVNRLNMDGSIDPSFTPYTPPGADDVYDIIELPDGKVVVASRWGGVTRIKTNGLDDPTFSYNYFSFSTTVTGFAVQSDGKIVFSAPGGNRVYRLNANGTTDATYQSQYNVTANYQEPKAIELQPDDKLLVYGNEEVYRFNTDGSLDPSFKQLKVVGGQVNDFLLDSTRLLVAGNYFEVNGLPINDLMGIDYSNDNTVGLDELSDPAAKESFQVYPNPISAGQKLSWKPEEKVESIAIYSMDGRLVQQQSVSSGENTVDLDVIPGTYIIHANSGSGKYKVAKLMVSF